MKKTLALLPGLFMLLVPATALAYGWGADGRVQGPGPYLLFVLGLALLSVEAFIPGFGWIGASGVVLVVISIVLVVRTAASPWAAAGSLVAATAIVAAVVRYAVKRGAWSRLTLNSTSTRASATGELPVKVGDEGASLTPLRPAGAARFGDHRVNVVTAGEYIAAGSPVVISSVTGGRVAVRLSEKP